MRKDPVPVIDDQEEAARAYFFSVFGLILIEGLIQIPGYINNLRRKGHPDVKASTSHSTLRVLFHRLTTLPSPLPKLSVHSYGTYFRTTIIFALNILFGYNRIRYTTDYKLYGWLTLANGGLTFLLAARSNLLGIILRVPAPTLLLYHRILGRVTLVHATLHFALTANHHARTKQLDVVLSNPQIQAGIVAFTGLCIVAITSVSLLRRKTFELFYYLHFFFAVFIIAALVHATGAREFFIPGLVLWGLDRALRFANNFRSLSVQSVAHYAGDLTKIKVQGLERSHPGQIAFVQIPSISFVNWHPFTIASAPQDDAAVFAIRGLGSYTKKVQQLDTGAAPSGSGMMQQQHQPAPAYAAPAPAVSPTNLKIRLDGPYPQGGLQYDQYPVVALVAGGIGITPAMSIASHIAHRAASPVASESPNNRWHVHLVWVVKEAAHTSWFEEELTLLDQMMERSRGRATLDVTIFATGGASRTAAAGSGGEEASYAMEQGYKYSGPGRLMQGRPNMYQWFQGVKSVRRGLDVAVNLCGPRRLIDDAKRAAAKTSAQDGLFFVEEEVFEF